jgi:hypothetical protein
MTNAYPLIDKLKHDPLSFTLADAKTLTEALENEILPEKIIRKTAIEVLDLSPNGIFRSGATEGIVGMVNTRNRAKRQEQFWDRIQQDFRKNKNNIVVLAEGDSWFDHPFLQDIIDHLNRNKNVAVFSLAFAADWLDNMLYQGEYIDMLSVIKPDVFMVSGGGNDLLGDKKISIMCHAIKEGYYVERKECIFASDIPKKYADGLKDNKDAKDIKAGVKYLTKEFFSFLNVMQWQYYVLFSSVRKKYEYMPILTQSYDFATPQGLIKRSWTLSYWYQRPFNTILQSGKWLETTMRNAQIDNLNTMHQIIKAMLYLFKSMVIETATDFKYIYHIDSQGISEPKDWFDEIHVKSHKFLQISQTYVRAMQEVIQNRDTVIAKGSSEKELPRVFRSAETPNSLTFWASFKAFYTSSVPFKVRITKLWNLYWLYALAIALIAGFLYWVAPTFACQLGIVIAGGWLFTKLYQFLRAVTMSIVYSKKRAKTPLSTPNIPPSGY